MSFLRTLGCLHDSFGIGAQTINSVQLSCINAFFMKKNVIQRGNINRKTSVRYKQLGNAIKSSFTKKYNDSLIAHRRSTQVPNPGGGVLKKVLYGEAPPRGPTPYPFIYHFFRKGTHFVYLLLEKGPFIYLFILSLARLMNKSLKQEVFLSFFSRSA